MVIRRDRPDLGRSALILLVAVAGCTEQAGAPESCAPPAALVAAVNAPPSSPASMEAALLHAAGPMTDALGTPSEVQELRAVMQDAATRVQVNADGACRAISTALDLLDSLPDNPATRPDRDGIRMVLALTARSLVTPTTATP